mgnify:CR=1 FL=1
MPKPPLIAVARRVDYEVTPIPHAVAVPLVARHPYARGAANTSIPRLGAVYRFDYAALVPSARPLR